MPHGINGGVTFVENNEEWRGGDTLCQCLAVQILSEGGKNSSYFVHFMHLILI